MLQDFTSLMKLDLSSACLSQGTRLYCPQSLGLCELLTGSDDNDISAVEALLAL